MRNLNDRPQQARLTSASPIRCAALVLALAAPSAVVADGLPLEYLLSNEWRNQFMASSPLSNPAFMTEENYLVVRGVFCPAVNAPSRLLEVGGIMPLGLYRSVGVSLVSELGLPVQGGTWSGTSDQNLTFDSSSTTVNNTNSLLMLSFADNPWKRLSYGVNLNLLRQSNFGSGYESMGLDAGATYRVLSDPLFGYHVAGVCAHNFLLYDVYPKAGRISAAQLDGTWHSAFLENTAQFDARLDLTDLFADRTEFIKGKKIEWDLFTQGGVWLMRIFTLNAFLKFGRDNVESWGASFGVNIPQVNNGRDLAFAYQFRTVRSSDLGVGHSIYLRCQVGRHREEIYARDLARGMDVSPNELYNRALKLYYAGEYWQAYFIFVKIKTEFPDFFKNDCVQHYKGACLEKLDFREAATEAYQAVLGEFPHSDMVPGSELGTMRINYRDGADEQVGERYRGLISMSRETEVPDSIKFHAAYLMGESAIRRASYWQAIQVLPLVPETHPDYVFAQHSLAIATILQGNDPKKAVEYLDNCVRAVPRTLDQAEVVNRSYLFIGYIYYELAKLPAAVAALRKVPQASAYYSEALLGLAWCAYRARNVDDCVTTGMALSSSASDLVIKSQGYLIDGCGLIFRKDYDNAEIALKAGQSLMKAYTPPQEDSLSLRQGVYESDRIVYRQTGERLVEIAATESRNVQRGDSLHTAQTGQKRKLDDFLLYNDRFKHLRLFGKDAATVKTDIDYTLARLGVMKGRSGAVRRSEQIQNVDQEIKQIQQKLHKIDAK